MSVGPYVLARHEGVVLTLLNHRVNWFLATFVSVSLCRNRASVALIVLPLSASLQLHSPAAIFESPMLKRSAFSGGGLFDRMLLIVSFAVS